MDRYVALFCSQAVCLKVLAISGQMREHFLLEGIALCLDDDANLIYKYRCVDDECKGTQHSPCSGIVSGGNGEHGHSLIIHSQGEHSEQSKCLCAVLQPDAAFDEELGNSAGNQQCKAGIHGTGGNAVVAVRHIPQIIGNDPKPKLICPNQ